MSTIVKKLPTKTIKAFSLADGQSYSAKQRFSKVTKINDLRRDMVVQKESNLGDLDKKKFFGIAQFQNGSFESEETNGVARLICFCFICHFYPPFTRKRIVSLYL